ncbi:MAG TPA: acyl-CoA dehydrogenase family protein [Ohtaekwangia sp.]|nr:acyl-CoA dehydrogenase family protein [Ohtaekwangia sp.]
MPEESGGFGKGLYALARICETPGKSYSSVGLCFGMHCVGTAVISAKATPWQQQQYLEPIANGPRTYGNHYRDARALFKGKTIKL